MSSDNGGRRGKLVIISGPSGSGKTTICRELVKHPGVKISVSVTTRAPRPREVEGQDYYFVGEDEFGRRVKEGRFVEHARYSGTLYGTLRKPLERALEEGLTYLLEVDVQGALQVMEKYPDAISIFIMPPGEDVLKRRLMDRNTDKEQDINRRLDIAGQELEHSSRYKYRVVNDKLEDALDEIFDILGLLKG
ncbi:MAG: guanylate kinase [Candidatus Brocadiales bacterium]|nr:guanylate kinase [Candidatus Bathyanammoxibius amoris]